MSVDLSQKALSFSDLSILGRKSSNLSRFIFHLDSFSFSDSEHANCFVGDGSFIGEIDVTPSLKLF